MTRIFCASTTRIAWSFIDTTYVPYETGGRGGCDVNDVNDDDEDDDEDDEDEASAS